MNKVLIKYGFIFNPNDSWSTQSDFEQDLGLFFASKGLKAEFIEASPGQEPVPVIYLTKMDNWISKSNDSVQFKTKPKLK